MSATPKKKTQEKIDKEAAAAAIAAAEQNRIMEERETIAKGQEQIWNAKEPIDQWMEDPARYSNFNITSKVHSDGACFDKFSDLARRLNELLVLRNNAEICKILVRCILARKRDIRDPSSLSGASGHHVHQRIIDEYERLLGQVCFGDVNTVYIPYFNADNYFFYSNDDNSSRGVPRIYHTSDRLMLNQAKTNGCLAPEQVLQFQVGGGIKRKSTRRNAKKNKSRRRIRK
jgi:hypothetical protein